MMLIKMKEKIEASSEANTDLDQVAWLCAVM